MQIINDFHSIEEAAQNFLFDRKVQGFTLEQCGITGINSNGSWRFVTRKAFH